MKQLIGFTSMLVLMGWGATMVFAVMPPVTSLESSQVGGMSPVDWFIYGSIVVVLGVLVVAAITLIVRLIIALFK